MLKDTRGRLPLGGSALLLSFLQNAVFRARDIVRLTQMDPALLQSWLNRGILGGKKISPGRGRERELTGTEALHLIITHILVSRFAISASVAATSGGLIAHSFAQEVRSISPTRLEDLYFFAVLQAGPKPEWLVYYTLEALMSAMKSSTTECWLALDVGQILRPLLYLQPEIEFSSEEPAPRVSGRPLSDIIDTQTREKAVAPKKGIS